MRAVIISHHGSPEVLKIREVQEPTVKPGELLVRVKATALNRADILQRKGFYPAPPGTRSDIPGLEFAGVIESSDPDCNFQVGDRVMGLLNGEGYAEKVAIHSSLVMPVPDNLDFIEAAAIPEAFLTAFDALFLQLGLEAEETVLIHAVGSGVGTAALQMGKCMSVRTIGTSSSDQKIQMAKKLGLDIGINSKTSNLVEAIQQATSGQMVDKILDLVGAIHWDANLKSLKKKGKMIVVGLVGGSKTEVDLGVLLSKRLTIIGTVLRARSLPEKAELIRQFSNRMLPLFEEGRLKAVVDSCFDLEEASLAHHHMEENRNFGKIVLQL